MNISSMYKYNTTISYMLFSMHCFKMGVSETIKCYALCTYFKIIKTTSSFYLVVVKNNNWDLSLLAVIGCYQPLQSQLASCKLISIRHFNNIIKKCFCQNLIISLLFNDVIMLDDYTSVTDIIIRIHPWFRLIVKTDEVSHFVDCILSVSFWKT